MNNTHSCPEPEELAALIDGELTGNERREILAHIENCELCSALLGDAMHRGSAIDFDLLKDWVCQVLKHLVMRGKVRSLDLPLEVVALVAVGWAGAS